MMHMTSRERVRATLAHETPDAVPIDFDATAVSGLHVSCVAALREHYGLERWPVQIHEPYQMLGRLDEDLKQAIGVDVEGVGLRTTMFGFRNEGWKPWRMPDGLEVLVPGAFNTTTDSNGDILLYPQGDLSAPPSGRMPKGGHFFDAIIRQEPIDEERLNPEDNLEEFTLIDDATLDQIADDVAAAVATGRAVVADFGGTAFGDISMVPAVWLKHPKGIRDVAQWYMSLKKRPEYVHAVYARQCDIALENLAQIHKRIGDTVDAVFVCGTDFGTQTSAFCSVDTFRELWFPYYTRVNDWVHEHTSWKTFKHSCGSVERFLTPFVECGFDIFNPVQCSAANMDAAELKRMYGDRLVFWGGGADTQATVPFGTPAEVREEVLRRCEIFADGGGFVFNTIHNVQAGTPVENIVAVIDAVHEFNGTA